MLMPCLKLITRKTTKDKQESLGCLKKDKSEVHIPF